MRISIITICYNNLEGLKKTAQSVINQRCRNFEWVIIDGNSTDGTKDYLSKIASHIDVCISEPDTGIYNAMNKGISKASGEYLLFLNSGDCFASTSSFSLIEKKQFNTDLVAFDVFREKNGGGYRYDMNPDRVNYHRLITNSLYHQAILIKRERIVNLGYDESFRIISDWAFWVDAILLHNYSYAHIKFPITIYDTNGISSINSELNMKERRVFLSRYMNPNIIDAICRERSLDAILDSQCMFPLVRKIVVFVYRGLSSISGRFYYPLLNKYMVTKYLGAK